MRIQKNNFKKPIIYFMIIGVLFLFSGCTKLGTNSLKYEKPLSTNLPNNNKIINKPFDKVWDNLVSELATSFFVINNIDKESRIINISFHSNTPNQFVDCGKTTRNFSFNKQTETYSYDTAESSSFKHAGKWGPYQNLPSVLDLNRKVSLDGRINIYIAPLDENTTKISVNVKYILLINLSGTFTGYNAFGEVSQQNTPVPYSHTCSFNTNEISTENWSIEANPSYTTCLSKGVLEKKLLNMAYKSPKH